MHEAHKHRTEGGSEAHGTRRADTDSVQGSTEGGSELQTFLRGSPDLHSLTDRPVHYDECMYQLFTSNRMPIALLGIARLQARFAKPPPPPFLLVRVQLALSRPLVLAKLLHGLFYRSPSLFYRSPGCPAQSESRAVHAELRRIKVLRLRKQRNFCDLESALRKHRRRNARGAQAPHRGRL